MATHTTIRIKKEYRNMLKEIANNSKTSMQEVLERAIEEYKRIQFFKELNQAYESLQEDKEAWADELEERALWDNTLLDDLHEEQ